MDNVYDFNHPERGLAIIINNEDFSFTRSYEYRKRSPKAPCYDRQGSSYDAMALYQTFKKLGFRVWVTKNLKSWQMWQVLFLGEKLTFAAEYNVLCNEHVCCS